MGIEKHRNELGCDYNYPATVTKITYLFRTITNTEILCVRAQDSRGQKDKAASGCFHGEFEDSDFFKAAAHLCLKWPLAKYY